VSSLTFRYLLSWWRKSLLLRNPKVHYRVYKISPFVPVLGQFSTVHISALCSSKVHFKRILQSTCRYPTWSVLLGLTKQIFVCIYLYPLIANRLIYVTLNKTKRWRMWSGKTPPFVLYPYPVFLRLKYLPLRYSQIQWLTDWSTF